ncbi:hypothetical protein [Archaeoglobus neptunius]|uniref:hypothetical protein n=1 Tax=Archaeoglobus neptunius TaxID=2798580 RepID=UPI001929776E|nr:hypothetical protein [Archaeoglobus neptunius]
MVKPKLAYQEKLIDDEGKKKVVQTVFLDVPSKGSDEKRILSVVIRNQKKTKTKQADLKIIGIRPHGQMGLEIILKED